jgi:hypothetical protein
MIHGRLHRPLFLVAWLTMMSVPAWPQEDDKLKSEYRAVSSQLQKHVVFDSWIDSDPESPKLLARQWSLAGEWVAAWLDSHPSEGPEGVKTALGEPVPDEGEPAYLKLNGDAFLVVAPSPIGNVFIAAKSDGHYHLAWSAAQPQEAAGGEQAVILAAWRPENATVGEGPIFRLRGARGRCCLV